MGLAAFNRMRRLAAEEAKKSSNNELEQLRARAVELGVPNAARLGEKKLREGIEAKENELKQLEEEKLKKAIELVIEGAEEKDADTMVAEIQALEEGKHNE